MPDGKHSTLTGHRVSCNFLTKQSSGRKNFSLTLLGLLLGALRIKLTKDQLAREKIKFTHMFTGELTKTKQNKMCLKEAVRIWGLYTISIGEQAEEKGHLWENKWLLGKIHGPLAEQMGDMIVLWQFLFISYPHCWLLSSDRS